MNSKAIHFFPIIYPGELFYSACSRYAYYTPYRGMNKLLDELFGAKRIRPSLKFASHLEEFCRRTGSVYTPREIFCNHTIYPYFSPFISRNRQSESLEAAGGSANHLLSIVGDQRYNAGRNRIRYCPECARESLLKFDEVYLHRCHHLEGIDCCPKHLIRLLDYPVAEDFSVSRSFLHLDPALMDFDSRIRATEIEERLARIAGEIMELPPNLYSIDDTLEYLRAVFIDQGMASTRLVNHKRIYSEILETYPEEFLRENNLMIVPKKLKKENYLSHLFRKRSSARPLVYLVLISLCADSFNGFVREAGTLLKEEPFPDFNVCRNPFCPDFNRSAARRLSVKGDKQEAVYRCGCGQVYRQYSDSPDHYHIVQYGRLYGEELTKRIENGESLSRLERETGITRKGLRKQLASDNFTRVDQKLAVYEKELEESLDRNLEEHLPLTSGEYARNRKFVQTYDPDFWETFRDKVEVAPGTPTPRSKDLSLDESYCRQVSEIAEQLYQKNPPVWVSQKRIISSLDPRASEAIANRLPETRKALVEVTETRHEYALRKVVTKIKELLEKDPDLAFDEASLIKALKMDRSRFEVYRGEIYNSDIFCLQNLK